MRILYGLLCLMFLVFFHELGHFIAAKLFGVKVEAFSIGFGPRLFHKKIRDTDYRISLVPLGGYCAMKGEKEFSESLKAGLDHIEASSDSIYGVHPLKRVLIAFAGPFSNMVFSFVSFFVIAMLGYSYYSYSTKIILSDELYPETHSAARDAGILSGDRIVSIDGKKTFSFSDILLEVSSRPDEEVDVTVERGGEEITFRVRTDFDKSTGTGKIGVAADQNTLEKFEDSGKPFFSALKKAFIDMNKGFYLIIKGIFSLFKGVDISKSLSGPYRVVDMLGSVVTESSSEGFHAALVNILNFMAYISLSLCFMNLLPVPILDGGLILFALIETVSRKKLSPKLLYYIQFAGLLFIVLVFFVGITGDVRYFLDNLKGD